MLRHAETFFRHRLLLTLPIVLALAISIGLTSMVTRMYQAQGNMWFDTPTAVKDSATTPAQTSTLTPSEQEVGVLNELLRTRAFTSRVGSRAPLAAYLAIHPSESTSIGSVLSRGLSHVGIGSGTPGSLDNRVFDALNSDITVAATGPQMVNITMTFGAPDVAASTVQAVIDQFSEEVLTSRRAAAQATVDYYQVRLGDAQKNAVSADETLNKYIAAATRPANASISTDPQLAALTRSADLAHQRYDVLLTTYDQANLDLLHVTDQSGFRIVDKPTVPASPLGVSKRLLSAGLAGVFIGLVVAVLGLVLLTLADTSARSTADVERQLGAPVAGTIRAFGSRHGSPDNKPTRELTRWPALIR